MKIHWGNKQDPSWWTTVGTPLQSPDKYRQGGSQEDEHSDLTPLPPTNLLLLPAIGPTRSQSERKQGGEDLEGQVEDSQYKIVVFDIYTYINMPKYAPKGPRDSSTFPGSLIHCRIHCFLSLSSGLIWLYFPMYIFSNKLHSFENHDSHPLNFH